MKEDQDYIEDITEMRSIMERSTKFLSLSGLAGILAGTYALSGAYIAYKLFNFNPAEIIDTSLQPGSLSPDLWKVLFLALVILILALGTGILLSWKKADKKREKLWNVTTKRLVINMAVPLIAGGILILILIFKGLTGLIAPFTLLFYGLALFNAGKHTYEEMRSLGIVEIVLSLISSWFIEYGLLFWALGFGVVHIIYGIYIHYKYER